MIKDGGLQESKKKSETESTIKPREADPKRGEVQSGSLQNKVNTLGAGENQEVDGGEEDDEEETEDEELVRVIKKMYHSIRHLNEINPEENWRGKQTGKIKTEDPGLRKKQRRGQGQN